MAQDVRIIGEDEKGVYVPDSYLEQELVTVVFDAGEFDVSLKASNLTDPNRQCDEVHKFTHKGSKDDDVPLNFNPTEVAGIAVAPIQTAQYGLRVM
jgi:hypothetical protein